MAHPSLYLGEGDIQAIRQRIEQDAGARGVFEALLEDCRRHLALEPSPAEGVFTESPLGVLGDEGPEQPAPSHFDLALRDGGAARDLALAYALTGNEGYAEKAARIVMAWAGSLEPTIPRPYRAWYEMARALPAFLYAADLIYDSGAFSEEDLDQLRTWAADLAADNQSVHVKATVVITAYSCNLIMCCGVIAEDQELFSWIDHAEDNADTYGSLIKDLFTEKGDLQKDWFRRPLRNAPEVLKGFALTAEAGRRHGLGFYDLQREGRSLKKAFLFYAPHLNESGAGAESPFLGGWPDWSAYQLAASYWGDDAFRKVLAHHAEPAFDRYVLGPVSLTHPAQP